MGMLVRMKKVSPSHTLVRMIWITHEDEKLPHNVEEFEDGGNKKPNKFDHLMQDLKADLYLKFSVLLLKYVEWTCIFYLLYPANKHNVFLTNF